eukprot:snap_masked-scaffold_6-processed-gene-3.43-mRNA-1 protein AED:1.00 eAED:1.00 QI:0/0/0/0/1/1/2/0/145
MEQLFSLLPKRTKGDHTKYEEKIKYCFEEVVKRREELKTHLMKQIGKRSRLQAESKDKLYLEISDKEVASRKEKVSILESEARSLGHEVQKFKERKVALEKKKATLMESDEIIDEVVDKNKIFQEENYFLSKYVWNASTGSIAEM